MRQTEIDGVPRLSMLETLREFGLEQLSHMHELESARRAHATYYLAFAEDAERQLTGVDQKIWLQRLEREQDNLRAALHWAIEHNEVEIAQRMAGALQPFWFQAWTLERGPSLVGRFIGDGIKLYFESIHSGKCAVRGRDVSPFSG